MGNHNLPRNQDDRDVVIRQLADDEALLLERISSLEADVGVYRELAAAACDALRDLTVRYQRLHASFSQLRDAYRALRARLLEAGADDVAA
jgi:phage shock protein A